MLSLVWDSRNAVMHSISTWPCKISQSLYTRAALDSNADDIDIDVEKSSGKSRQKRRLLSEQQTQMQNPRKITVSRKDRPSV